MVSAVTARTLGVGLLLPITSRGIGVAQLMEELVEEVRRAEEVDLDVVLVPEHHNGPPAMLSDPLSVVGWLLAKSERIRIGTGVLLLPLHNTLSIAERAATLQLASGGRLVLGLGAGYQATDFARFGVDQSARPRAIGESLAELVRLWTDRDEGSRPALDEAPRIWLGAWSDAGTKRAARSADAWIADPVRSGDDVARMAGAYRRHTQDAGNTPHVVLMREAWLAATDREAEQTYYPVIEKVFRYYHRNGVFPKSESAGLNDARLAAIIADRALVGSPVTVTSKCANLMDLCGVDTFIFALRHPGGPSHASVLNAITLLGTEVAPRLRDRYMPSPNI
jgi:alkanesulfonate monooxygenase SsuD/methylene tetrahydromethanopterin reductase-like flavin-dependent oxidoreductase (luciferase family)